MLTTSLLKSSQPASRHLQPKRISAALTAAATAAEASAKAKAFAVSQKRVCSSHSASSSSSWNPRSGKDFVSYRSHSTTATSLSTLRSGFRAFNYATRSSIPPQRRFVRLSVLRSSSAALVNQSRGSRTFAGDAKDLRARESKRIEQSKPISKTLEAARERTKAAGARVRSSLSTHENIYNLPNLLTASRLLAAPATAYLALHDQHAWAVALFAYAGITDLVDGWLARRWKLQTVAGSVIDPMADKALMIILTATLAVKGALPLYLATLIFGRDACLGLAAIYYRYASLPAPKTMARYWDFSLPSAEVHPTTVSKWNTFLQLILVGSTLAQPVALANSLVSAAPLHTALSALQLTVAATTVWSGLSYAVSRNVVTFLGKDEKLNAKQGARGRAIVAVSFGGVIAAAAWLCMAGDEWRESRPPPAEG